MSASYKLTLAYKGSAFSGFARQKSPEVVTVQEELEHALATALRLDAAPQTVCAGRTDAGVHARAQVVSFDLCLQDAVASVLTTQQCAQLVRSLNALTPAEISVSDLRPAPPGFSARFDALSREYRYRIYNNSSPPIFSADYAWHIIRPLNIEAMRTAADHLLGEHDFYSFCTTVSAEKAKTTVRRITHINFMQEDFCGENLLTIQIIGNAFLHSMVRIITGTLQEVGAGKRNASEIPVILAARNRNKAGQTAPAHGLTLHRVECPEHTIMSFMV